MKSIYSDFIKYITKESKVCVQRINGCYIVGSGFVAAGIPEADYRKVFVPASDLFQEFDKSVGLRIDFKEKTATVMEKPMDFNQFFRPDGKLYELSNTGIMFRKKEFFDKGDTCSVFMQESGNGRKIVTAVNNKYLDLFKKYPLCTARSINNHAPVIFFDDSHTFGYIIMPARIDGYVSTLEKIVKNTTF